MENYNYNIEILDEKICLLYFNKEHYNKVMYMLMKDVLLQNSNKFFSLTICDNEISLFIDQSIFEKIAEKNEDTYHKPNAVEKDYRAIRIFDNVDGVSHIGIVSKISTVLSKSNISILYVNSYNNNYILLSEKDLQEAKECLI